jgi:hypothetical protein
MVVSSLGQFEGSFTIPVLVWGITEENHENYVRIEIPKSGVE